jgi:N-acetyltransferase 10
VRSKPRRLHYLGVSFGLTQQLLNFWCRAGFAPLYLRQSASDTTGEHTVVMLAALEHPDVRGGSTGGNSSTDEGWLSPFVSDFRARFMSLLGGAFRTLPPALALSMLSPRLAFGEAEGAAAAAAAADGSGPVVTRGDGRLLGPHDLKRLQARIHVVCVTLCVNDTSACCTLTLCATVRHSLGVAADCTYAMCTGLQQQPR